MDKDIADEIIRAAEKEEIDEFLEGEKDLQPSTLDIFLQKQDEVNKFDATKTFREIFPTAADHMRTIMQMYKKMFGDLEEAKPFWKKNNKDIIADAIDHAAADFSANIENNLKQIRLYELHEIQGQFKLIYIGKLIELCFSYFVWQFDEEAPFISLPSRNKYPLIMSVLDDGSNRFAAARVIFDKWFCDAKIHTLINFYSAEKLISADTREQKLAIINSMRVDIKDLLEILLRNKINEL
jgi:hypothetical protein